MKREILQDLSFAKHGFTVLPTPHHNLALQEIEGAIERASKLSEESSPELYLRCLFIKRAVAQIINQLKIEVTKTYFELSVTDKEFVKNCVAFQLDPHHPVQVRIRFGDHLGYLIHAFHALDSKGLRNKVLQ